MKVISFIRDRVGLREVEVEVSITRGLPKIQFLGLPDAAMKESILRIQSAFKNSDYQLPKAQQILINLKPHYLKKSSRGLDLAVASAILWETQQIPKPSANRVAVYGELSLKGDVSVPDDFDEIDEHPQAEAFYTGAIKQGREFELYSVGHLRDLRQPTFFPREVSSLKIQRPIIPKILIDEKQNRLLEIVALGEHPTLLSGPPGTGKSTLAMAITTLLEDPPLSQFKKYKKFSRFFGIPVEWRPIVNPHHTSTPLSMIGGGGFPRPGEITRAHGGVLLMDEFLEFDPKVQEALREPMETGKMTISRSSGVAIYPADFLLLATTNLCPCGYLRPEKNFECRGRPKMCSNYIQKLSGPMIDRFAILALSHQWAGEKSISIHDTYEKILKVRSYKKDFSKKVNQKKSLDEIEERMNAPSKKISDTLKQSSFRRYQSLLRVASTISDLDFSTEIKPIHVDEAYEWTNKNIEDLKRYALNWNY